ncbi:MAG: TonB-dependent receptor plug domain-containing protein [Bacteroidia bacterium]|nr:TonB-dependent receptor plug domain-containing protein [Bacteroidia bacterium]
MKRAFFFFLIFICISGEINSQIKIRGTVTNADGEPIKRVRVFAGEGHLSFSHTDINGEYAIRISEKATKLKFSRVGMKSCIIPVSGRSVDAVLEKASALEENKKRKITLKAPELPDSINAEPEFKSENAFQSANIGYEVEENSLLSASMKQVLSGKKLNPSHQNNINNILAGKVAGLKLFGQSEMALGRTGYVTLRGQSGLSTGESLVYIVDGTLISDINDINYNEIEKVTVLSGPSSTALLGSKASNGAVIITTKRSTRAEDKSEIELNSGINFSRVSMLPAYQDSYAGGYMQDMLLYEYRPGIDPVDWAQLDGKYYHNYYDDSSWGPRMAGQEYIPWYSWYPGTEYTGTTAKLVPQPDNIKDFYNTGLTTNNNIAFTRSKGDFYIRALFGNIDTKGLMPNTSFNRNNFSLKASYNIKERLKFEADLYFFTRMLKGEFDDKYGNNTTGTFNQWFHRDLDMDMLKELSGLRSPVGSYASWNHSDPKYYDPSNPLGFYGSNYGFNSYTWMEIADFSKKNNHLIGNISLTYKISKGIDLKIAYRRQEMNGWSETKIPFHYYSGLQSSYYGYGNGYYETGTSYSNAENLEGLLHFDQKISDLSLVADMGSDFYSTMLKANSANTVNGLIVDELYTISNSRDQAYFVNKRSEEKQRAFFLKALTGYRDIILFDLVLRKEFHSTLPPENNSILAKSFGGTFIFSNLFSVPFLDFGKIRFAWGEIPESIPVYTYPGVNYTIGNYYWNSNRLSSTPDYLVPSSIKGPVKKETEAGLDLDLFKSRIRFSFTWWKQGETGIPVNAKVSSYSGFGTIMINSGEIEKKGIDLSVSINPISSANFSWETIFIFSKLLRHDVINITDGATRMTSQSSFSSWGPELIQEKGKPWGELYGSGMKIDPQGRPYLNSDGSYVADPYKYFGSVLPKYTGGIQNSFMLFKDFVISINLDYQYGGKFFSLSEMWGTYSGLTEWTADINDKRIPVRDPVADGGGFHVFGVSQTTGEAVDYYVDAQEYFHNLHDDRIFDSFVYDASYIKLREISLDYRIPVGRLKIDKYVSGATISFYTQNPWMIWSSQGNFDPSELTYISGEQAQFPSVRTFGANLQLIF